MKKEISQIHYNEETDLYELDNKDLHCGDCLTVLVVNGLTNKAEWIETSLENNGEDWYLVGLIGYEIGGLFAYLD